MADLLPRVAKAMSLETVHVDQMRMALAAWKKDAVRPTPQVSSLFDCVEGAIDEIERLRGLVSELGVEEEYGVDGLPSQETEVADKDYWLIAKCIVAFIAAAVVMYMQFNGKL